MQQGNAKTWGIIIVLVILSIGAYTWYQSMPMSNLPSIFSLMGWGKASEVSSSPNVSSQTGTQTSETLQQGADLQAPPVDDSLKDKSAAYIAAHIAGATQFGTLLSSTGADAQVMGKGPYTIFVTTDGAISQLPQGTISTMTAAQKKRLVQYHIIVGRAIASQAVVAGTIQSLSGDALNFSYGSNKIPMVNSAIMVVQYPATNGVVYLIDNVLLPPKK